MESLNTESSASDAASSAPDAASSASKADTSASNTALRAGASIQALERSIDRLTFWEHVFAVGVVVGLILEYLPMFEPIVHHPRLAFLHHPTLLLVMHMAGGAMVALGVAGELFFGFRANHKDNRLRELNADIAARQSDTIAGLNLMIAELNLKIAELNLLAEQERRARVRLEHIHSQRSVSPEQRRVIVSRLSKHRGQRFVIAWPNGDGESQFLAQSVAASLENAGWELDPTIQVALAGVGRRNIFTGLSVFTNPTDAKSNSAADDLPLVMDVSLRVPEPNIPPGVIGIAIPPKPPDPESLREIAQQRLAPSSPFSNELIALVTQLSQFRGQAVSVEAPFADENAANLASDFFAAFSMAQWEVVDGPFSAKRYPTDFENVRVGVSDVDDRENTVPQAAHALMRALKKIGAARDDDQLRLFQGMPRGQICVRVGISPFAVLHPPPLQTPPATAPES